MDLLQLQDKKISLVLSGGGVKGIAHIGILKALHEHGIFPEIISGVSAGAIVGALYANNISIQEMLVFFKETPLLRYNFVTINKPGFFDTDKYKKYLSFHFPENTFEALKRPLHIVATNIQEGKAEFFNSGELITPILASAALPPVFSPVTFNNKLYVDGGVMNNFPVEPLIDTSDYIIGSYTSSMTTLSTAQLKNSFQLTQRTNVLMLHANACHKLKIPNLLFNPPHLDKIGILDKKGLEKAYTLGYDYASKKLEMFV